MITTYSTTLATYPLPCTCNQTASREICRAVWHDKITYSIPYEENGRNRKERRAYFSKKGKPNDTAKR